MAKGGVKWTDPPQNAGKITRTDDGTNNEYPYDISAGDTVNGYIPQLGDPVIFNNIETPARHATGVQLDAPILSIQTFVVAANADGSNDLSWVTTGASTGNIQYVKQDGTAGLITIAPDQLNSSSVKLAAADTAVANPAHTNKYYKLTIYDAAGANNSKTTYAQ